MTNPPPRPDPAPPVSPVAPVPNAFEDAKHLFGGADAPPASQQVAQAAHGKGEELPKDIVDAIHEVEAASEYLGRGDLMRRMDRLDRCQRANVALHEAIRRALAAPPALAGATGASVEEVAKIIHAARFPQAAEEGDWDTGCENWREKWRSAARAVLARLGATGEKSNG